MATAPEPQDVLLQPPPRLLYCALCDRNVRAFCADVLQCRERPHGRPQCPPDRAARGVIVGVGLGAVLWALLALGAWLVGVL